MEYSINSLGVRDDEAALNNPEIVVVGDSQAMGWAVGREQTFPALIGKQTGKKILNTGGLFLWHRPGNDHARPRREGPAQISHYSIQR